jgi:hypothetical protein
MVKKNNGLAPLPKKRDSFSAIKRFMVDADINLRVEEEAILKRWEYCDALLRAKTEDEDGIIAKLVEMFKISTFTARNDIAYTQRLFADARKINKRYLIHLHLERIDQDIQRMRNAWFKTEVGKDGKVKTYVPDSKELSAYAKLNEAYTYTLNSIPEEVQVDKQPPPIFQFHLAPGQVIDRPLVLEDAMAKADAILLKQNKDGVYTNEENEE